MPQLLTEYRSQMLYRTVQHPIIMHIATVTLICKTCSLYQNYGFVIIIIIIINGSYETQNSINTVYKINLRNWVKNLPLIEVLRGHIFGDHQG
jgi:hypothetical protein